ncbi:hypothetical protein C444_18602 [Haloarcula japonica DSM 6131]|uniref:Uncharacterized protein n=1 Tax=Haloarcula japonica (strain ATCC 49778 / DSM 6131 / JCM 7785 / NBRC 101032 / NCIMB 13157 / TR-1) TaxID=1227453 RepID=M0L546_HALJT|nr:hypothetical protein C444_18602 [Haloarcula japonica DSM 6131]
MRRSVNHGNRIHLDHIRLTTTIKIRLMGSLRSLLSPSFTVKYTILNIQNLVKSFQLSMYRETIGCRFDQTVLALKTNTLPTTHIILGGQGQKVQHRRQDVSGTN